MFFMSQFFSESLAETELVNLIHATCFSNAMHFMHAPAKVMFPNAILLSYWINSKCNKIFVF